jgi:hypothetical protein
MANDEIYGKEGDFDPIAPFGRQLAEKLVEISQEVSPVRVIARIKSGKLKY